MHALLPASVVEQRAHGVSDGSAGWQLGNTALHLAALVDSAEGVRALLEGGCDASVLNTANETALCVAAKNKSAAAAAALRERGVRGDKHMLLVAVEGDDRELVEESVQAGADVNAKDSKV
jgi:ankyrin repeat protein